MCTGVALYPAFPTPDFYHLQFEKSLSGILKALGDKPGNEASSLVHEGGRGSWGDIVRPD